MTCDHDAGVKKKLATFETSDSEADVDDYKYDAYEKLQPTRVRNMKGEARVRVGAVFIVFLYPYLISSNSRHDLLLTLSLVNRVASPPCSRNLPCQVEHVRVCSSY